MEMGGMAHFKHEPLPRPKRFVETSARIPPAEYLRPEILGDIQVCCFRKPIHSYSHTSLSLSVCLSLSHTRISLQTLPVRIEAKVAAVRADAADVVVRVEGREHDGKVTLYYGTEDCVTFSDKWSAKLELDLTEPAHTFSLKGLKVSERVCECEGECV
jgi:hypothetical protein